MFYDHCWNLKEILEVDLMRYVMGLLCPLSKKMYKNTFLKCLNVGQDE